MSRQITTWRVVFLLNMQQLCVMCVQLSALYYLHVGAGLAFTQ